MNPFRFNARMSVLARACPLALSLAAGHAAATVINVPADQPTIQDAVNVAVTGDEIVVADGVYSGPGFTNVDLQGKDLVIRSANGPAATTLDGGFQGRAFLVTSGQTQATVIEGFTFDNHGDFFTDEGGAILVQASGATIRNSVFRNGVALEGGAIAAVGSAEVSIEGCRFGAPDFADSGGAIYINASTVNIASSEFRDIDLNTISGGGSGGAINMLSGELNIVDSIFENITAGQGGAIRTSGSSANPTILNLTGSTFRNNSTAGIGGAIRTFNTDMTMVDCLFEGNFAETRQGGAIYASATFMTLVENCQFIDNSAGDPDGGGEIHGGAIRFLASGGRDSFGDFVDCLFEGNSVQTGPSATEGAARGGAIYQFTGSSTFTNCVFRNNTAHGVNVPADTVYGGAIAVRGTSDMLIVGCLFEGNVARNLTDPTLSSWGGAVASLSSSANLTIEDSEFYDNDSQQGAVYLQGFVGSANIPNHLVKDCVFEDNTSRFGTLRIATNMVVEVTGCVFRNNFSEASRGALAVANADTYVTIEDCLFENNTATTTGGAIGLLNATEVIVRNCVFDSNIGTTSGGAIRIDHNDSSSLGLSSVLVEGCEFRNNESPFGGAISMPLFSGGFTVDLTVRDSIFENNNANQGGAMHIQGFEGDATSDPVFAAVVIEDSVFRNNASGSNGGAIRVFTGADLAITRTAFEDNSAGTNGGALWLQSVAGDGLRDVVILGSSAVENGGAISHLNADRGSTLNITNTLIANSQAGQNGGGIRTLAGAATNILNSTIASNSAELGGNAISAAGAASVRLDNSIVWGAGDNTTDQINLASDASVTANWSNIQGGETAVVIVDTGTTNWLAGNINANPVFADPANDDFTLAPGSASVDAGDSSLVSDIDFDLAGNPRVIDAVNYA
ncbi:MAG: hypothetical protein EA423_11420, partial [Phycisphaerales bacterium]